MAKIPVGTRVVFKTSWDIFACDTIIPQGAKGTLTGYDLDSDNAWVRIDTTYPGLSDWHNEVYLDSEIMPQADIIRPI